ncbi:MAG: hypothetical protein M0D57_20660 [Sphingobacteriales bacterium JAD_PAG50586_3]|nr:MAG: hypothetical protein M0D57_20660 [Sphingobacteriales bacterium JAD_PAG50586_3]
MSTRRNNNKIGNFKEQIHLASIRRLKYKKSDLSAPIGFYRGFEVGLGFLVTTDVKGTTSYNNGGGYLAAGTKLITVRPLFDLVYGRRMGLGKRFTFNTSINVGVSGLIGSIIEALTSPNGAESKSDAERNIRRESALNFYKKHMLQLNFGFSFLIN